MKDRNDIEEWLKEGMIQASVFWQTTYGVPLENFQDWCHKLLPTKGQQMIFIDNLIKQKKICLK